MTRAVPNHPPGDQLFIQRFVTQPFGTEYRTLLADGAEPGGFSHFDVAVAYATSSGVTALTSTLEPFWTDWRKRWLVGIDWCRSEPFALRRLLTVSKSQVRIHDGARLATTVGCTPSIPYHPKAYVLRSASTVTVVSGSGNLSDNGLRRGHEVGSLLYVDGRRGEPENTLRTACQSVSVWFDDMWRRGSPLTTDLLRLYESRFDASRAQPSPTDDDVISPEQLERRRGLTREDLIQLRMASRLWIEAGNLHKNRGPGQAGNQLMMTPMTRVFFGFPAQDLPRDTRVGYVFIDYEGVPVERSLRFSNNSMDVLGLPVPGEEGPDAYDLEVLLFTKSATAGNAHFTLALGTTADRVAWRRRSEVKRTLFTMTSGRRWGVF